VDNTRAHSGTQSLKIATSASDKEQLRVAFDPATMAGQTIVFQCWVWLGSAGTVTLRVIDSSGATICSGVPAAAHTSTTGAWVQLYCTGTISNDYDLFPQIQMNAAMTVWADEVMLGLGTTPNTFDPVQAKWYTRFVGRAMDFNQVWPTGRQNYAAMQLSCAGGWRQKLAVPLGNALDTAFRLMPLVGYWPLDDPAGSLSFASGIPGKSALQVPNNIFAGGDDGTGSTPADSLPDGYGSAPRAYVKGGRMSAFVQAIPTYGGDILDPDRSGAACVIHYPSGASGTGEKAVKFRFTDVPNGSVVADVVFQLAYDNTTAHKVYLQDNNGVVLNTLTIPQQGYGSQLVGVSFDTDALAASNLEMIARIGNQYAKVTGLTIMSGALTFGAPWPAAIYFQPSTTTIDRVSHLSAWAGHYLTTALSETMPPKISQTGETDAADSHSSYNPGAENWKDDLLHLQAAVNAHAESSVWQETLPQRFMRLGGVAGYPFLQMNVDGSYLYSSWGYGLGTTGIDAQGSQPVYIQTGIPNDASYVRPASQNPEGASAIDLLRDAGRGLFQVYEAADGTLRCDDLRTRYNEAAWLTLPFTSILPDFQATLDDQKVLNQVKASTPQGTATYIDRNSQAKNGVYSKDISSRVSIDRDPVAGIDKTIDPLQVAAWQAHPTADLRLPMVHWHVHRLSATDLVSFLNAEPVGALLALSTPPSQLGVETVNLNVAGYTEVIDHLLWDFQANVEPRAPYDRVWTVADSTYGYAGIDGAYINTGGGISAGATTITLGSPTANGDTQPAWTTSGGEFPQYWRLGSRGSYGGEVVKVTGIAGSVATIVRAQWGTAAAAHGQFTYIENALRVVMGL